MCMFYYIKVFAAETHAVTLYVLYVTGKLTFVIFLWLFCLYDSVKIDRKGGRERGDDMQHAARTQPLYMGRPLY